MQLEERRWGYRLAQSPIADSMIRSGCSRTAIAGSSIFSTSSASSSDAHRAGRCLEKKQKQFKRPSNIFVWAASATPRTKKSRCFPAQGRESGSGALEEIQGLEDDHETANGLHAVVESLYLKWISDGSLVAFDAQQLASGTARLKELYAAHIQLEEQLVFPRAAQLLDSDTIRTIGQEFRNRRV